MLLLRILDCWVVLTGPDSKACLRNDDDWSLGQALSSCCNAVAVIGAAELAVLRTVEQLLDGTYCKLLLFDG